MGFLASLISVIAQLAVKVMEYINTQALVELGRHDAELAILKEQSNIQEKLDAIQDTKASPGDTPTAILSKL